MPVNLFIANIPARPTKSLALSLPIANSVWAYSVFELLLLVSARLPFSTCSDVRKAAKKSFAMSSRKTHTISYRIKI